MINTLLNQIISVLVKLFSTDLNLDKDMKYLKTIGMEN